jgi:hypothetical protein
LEAQNNRTLLSQPEVNSTVSVSAIWCWSEDEIPSGSIPTKEAKLNKGDKEDETPSKTSRQDVFESYWHEAELEALPDWEEFQQQNQK